MWDVLATENNFVCIIVFFSSTICISVFERSPVAHELILPSVCARRAYPRWFLGHVGRTPYRRHSLDDGSKCRRGKGLKTVCIAPTRTSVDSDEEEFYKSIGRSNAYIAIESSKKVTNSDTDEDD